VHLLVVALRHAGLAAVDTQAALVADHHVHPFALLRLDPTRDALTLDHLHLLHVGHAGTRGLELHHASHVLCEDSRGKGVAALGLYSGCKPHRIVRILAILVFIIVVAVLSREDHLALHAK
jgi:hypothetical protein